MLLIITYFKFKAEPGELVSTVVLVPVTAVTVQSSTEMNSHRTYRETSKRSDQC